MLPLFFPNEHSVSMEDQMKCVCPMGGDRTCPDTCPLAVWANLSSVDRKTQRKAIAALLYQEGFTMEQIATQLGVHHSQIVRDLKFVHSAQIKKAKTASNPKGAGRPKGTGPQPQRRTVSPTVEQTAASLVLDQGKTYDQAKTELGLRSVATVKTAVAREEGRREPQIERAELSMTAQQKFDAALTRAKKELQASFDKRVYEELKRRAEETFLPSYNEKYKQYEHVMAAYRKRGMFTAAEFKMIRACLHEDLVQGDKTKRRAREAFQLWSEKGRLVVQKDEPLSDGPHPAPLPQTWADWEAAKRQTTAARRAARGASNTPARR
jgi:predicted ArsR family transcriptional regulator